MDAYIETEDYCINACDQTGRVVVAGTASSWQEAVSNGFNVFEESGSVYILSAVCLHFCQDFVSNFSSNDKCPIPNDDPNYDESYNLGLLIGIPIGFLILCIASVMTCYCKG